MRVPCLLVAATALSLATVPAGADQILGPGRIDGAGTVLLPGGPALGRWQGGKFFSQPDALNLPSTDQGSTGSVDGFSVGGRKLPKILNDIPATLQSFGAVGDGIADDTAAVQAALNSGRALTCQGRFKITGLVTVQGTKDIHFKGTRRMCTFLYATSQSMIYINEQTSRGPLYKITIHDLSIIVQAAIISVVGPDKTAAIYIKYDGGGVYNGPEASVDMDHVTISTDAPGHYVNGIYLYQTNVSHLNHIVVQGDPTTLRGGVNAITYDGANSPTTLYVTNSQFGNVDNGVLFPPVTASGWQGARLHNIDCTPCNIMINAIGGSDGLADYIDIRGLEGTFYTVGVQVSNVSHVFINQNYIFQTPVPVGQVAIPAFPMCINLSQTLPMNRNGGSASVTDNVCDGFFNSKQTHTARIGINLAGYSRQNLQWVIGSNRLANLDKGINVNIGVAGVLFYPQSFKNVTTGISNGATAGDNATVASTAF
ncbi:glycoside hydrolase family 55 protein [Methylobacterium sp. E-025]|uniref:glycoside hydrolase family 55 protein n=1 Tax=Methylobacterium sp. E-025 TaxID=2836561 RepID=UPI001FB88EF3|nr:glycoside hydrolase family 55 protein [Methylobacterium sp. E-025]MCJ2112988.1 glycoside hydrolase family 55 protein [Methylobacterium sp. E-025]